MMVSVDPVGVKLRKSNRLIKYVAIETVCIQCSDFINNEYFRDLTIVGTWMAMIK